VRRFHQFQYAAQSWSRKHKVIARIEATDLGADARFIVTNLSGRGKTLYQTVYCQRGAAENLIKDMKRTTRSDKTACSRWEANQFRLSAHGCLLVATCTAPRGTQALTLARRYT
jgi:hypothetical protein